MAVPKALLPSLTPDELAFVSEQHHLRIAPLFAMTRVRLVAGIYGPFHPPAPATVPIWMALSLKRKKKCRILPPDWLALETLQDILTNEKENAHGFERLPRRFIEISKALLDTAPDDIPQSTQLRSLLKDIRQVRQAKIRMGLQAQDVLQSDYLQVTNLTPLELSELKPFLTRAMGVMQTLKPQEEADEVEDE